MRGEKRETGRRLGRARLRSRLVALGVLPVLSAALVGALLVAGVLPIPASHHPLAVLLAAAVAALTAAIAGRLLADRIARPMDALLDFADGDEDAVLRLAMRDSPSWEIYTLYRRVQQLVQQNRAGRRALEAVEGFAREAESLSASLADLVSEDPRALETPSGPLAAINAGLAEFLRRRGRIRREADELARQVLETLDELGAAVSELASRAEKGYLASAGAAFAQRELERRLESALRTATAATPDSWSAPARHAVDEAGRIENRLAVLALRHAGAAPPAMLAELWETVALVRSFEEGTRSALGRLQAGLSTAGNGLRSGEAASGAVKEKVAEIAARIAEASTALESTSRAAERAGRLAAQAGREVKGFRQRLASEERPISER
jgi:methyl-accepting chemotaxis protein